MSGPHTIADAAAAIRGAARVMITCHLSPDGDAMGSMLALGALLGDHGHQVTLFNPDGVPRYLRWLPHTGRVQRVLPAGVRFDLSIAVDCGDRKLLGPNFPAPEITGPLLVLDHHASSRPFGDIHVCEPDAASIGVLCARLAAALDWDLSEEAALAIYVSIVSDTGGFRYANTNAEAFTLAARLVAERNVNPWTVTRALSEEVPLARYRLLAAALATITLEVGGKVAVMTINDAMVRTAGAKWEHTEGLVSYARGLEGVECGMLISPARDGGTRVSLRSKGGVDCGAICAVHGGGGHVGAGGVVVAGTLDETRAIILAALTAALTPPTPSAPTA